MPQTLKIHTQHIPATALETQVERTLAKVSNAARRWLDARANESGPIAAALAAGDLDIMVRSIVAAQAELKPLILEIQRRRQAARLDQTGGAVQPPPRGAASETAEVCAAKGDR